MHIRHTEYTFPASCRSRNHTRPSSDGGRGRLVGGKAHLPPLLRSIGVSAFDLASSVTWSVGSTQYIASAASMTRYSYSRKEVSYTRVMRMLNIGSYSVETACKLERGKSKSNGRMEAVRGLFLCDSLMEWCESYSRMFYSCLT